MYAGDAQYYFLVGRDNPLTYPGEPLSVCQMLLYCVRQWRLQSDAVLGSLQHQRSRIEPCRADHEDDQQTGTATSQEPDRSPNQQQSTDDICRLKGAIGDPKLVADKEHREAARQ